MAQILVRNLEDDVKLKLRSRAQNHGRSTEEEVREILRNAVREPKTSPTPMGTRLLRRFAAIDLDLEFPELRGQSPRPARFDP
jgi:plasmid stability protein